MIEPSSASSPLVLDCQRSRPRKNVASGRALTALRHAAAGGAINVFGTPPIVMILIAAGLSVVLLVLQISDTLRCLNTMVWMEWKSRLLSSEIALAFVLKDINRPLTTRTTPGALGVWYTECVRSSGQIRYLDFRLHKWTPCAAPYNRKVNTSPSLPKITVST